MRDVAFRSGDLEVDATAFADNLMIFASTPEGLQERLEETEAFFAQRGLTINIHKSFTVALVPSGKLKKTKI